MTDRALRNLERKAATGDAEAKAKLWQARWSLERCLECGAGLKGMAGYTFVMGGYPPSFEVTKDEPRRTVRVTFCSDCGVKWLT